MAGNNRPAAQGSIWEVIHMRKTLLTSAALFSVVVTAPVLTQPTVTPPTTAPGSSVTAEPAPPNGEPVTGKPTESGVAAGPLLAQETAPQDPTKMPQAELAKVQQALKQRG